MSLYQNDKRSFKNFLIQISFHYHHLLKISSNSVNNFLSYFADRQTNQCCQKPILLCRGNKTISASINSFCFDIVKMMCISLSKDI